MDAHAWRQGCETRKKRAEKRRVREGAISAGMESPFPVYTAEEIHDEIAQRAPRIRSMLGAFANGLDYCCVEEYVAERGRPFTTVMPTPDGSYLMAPGNCFSNAFALTRWACGGLLYCEGFAGYYASHHAWCVLTDDPSVIVDPTWDSSNAPIPIPYFGCIFSDAGAAHGLWDENRGRQSLQHDVIRTFPGFFTFAMPRVFTAKRGVKVPTFGPWVEQVRKKK